MKKFVLFLLVVLAVTGFSFSIKHALAQNPSFEKAFADAIKGVPPSPGAPAMPPAPVSDKKYLALVDAAVADPAKADWKEIRREYIGSSFARENGALFNVKFRMQVAVKKMSDGKIAESVADLKELMRHHFGNIGSHILALDIATKEPSMAGQINPALENTAIDGLLKVIAATGDGKSQATAFRTICCDEDGAIVEKWLKAPAPRRIAMWNENGNPHYVSPVGLSLDGKETKVFFETDDEAKKNEPGDAAAAKEHLFEMRKENDKVYLALVEKAKANPDQADWQALREMYTRTTFFPTWTNGSVLEIVLKAAEKAQTEHTPEAIAAFQTLVDQHYAHIETHLAVLKVCNDFKPDFIDCKGDLNATKRLVENIQKSGYHGDNEENAFKVIGLAEERFIMNAFKLRPTGQTLINKNGHQYDRWSVVDADSHPQNDIFFNIDLFSAREDEAFTR